MISANDFFFFFFNRFPFLCHSVRQLHKEYGCFDTLENRCFVFSPSQFSPLSFLPKRMNQTSECSLQPAPAMPPPSCETYMESPEMEIPDVKCLFSRATVIQDQLNDQMGRVLMTSTCGFSPSFFTSVGRLESFPPLTPPWSHLNTN